jgi:hypothetical protein
MRSESGEDGLGKNGRVACLEDTFQQTQDAIETARKLQFRMFLSFHSVLRCSSTWRSLPVSVLTSRSGRYRREFTKISVFYR